MHQAPGRRARTGENMRRVVAGFVAIAIAGIVAVLAPPLASDASAAPAPPPVVKAQTNSYVGSETCEGCHNGQGGGTPEGTARKLYDDHQTSGHPYKLMTPSEAQARNVPVARGFDWTEIYLVIGGYRWKARYIDQQGYIITSTDTDNDGDPNEAPYGGNQWNKQTERWANYDAAANSTKAYSCGKCHTTGYDGTAGTHQDGKAGIVGTWNQKGIQCEQCHGQGGLHVDDPALNDMAIDERSTLPSGNPEGGQTCGACHNRFDKSDTAYPAGDFVPDRIPASITGTWAGGNEVGYIDHHQQYEEYSFTQHNGNDAQGQPITCATCHDPHKKTEKSINATATCESCHTGEDNRATVKVNDFAGSVHERLGVTCVDCHMAKADKSAEGYSKWQGDIRTHLVNIDPDDTGSQFEDLAVDGGTDRTKHKGSSKTHLTVGRACLQCHQDKDTTWAADNAEGIHSQDSNAVPHGGYSSATNYCLQCHDVHESQSNGGYALLSQATVKATCQTCHAIGGMPETGAGTPSGGGATGTAAVRTAYDLPTPNTDKPSAPPVLAAATHGLTETSIPGGPGSFTWTASDWNQTWLTDGAPATDSVEDVNASTEGGLYCGSCHTPHGEFGQLINSDFTEDTPISWENPSTGEWESRTLHWGTNGWEVCAGADCDPAQVLDAEGRPADLYGYKLLTASPNHTYSETQSYRTEQYDADAGKWCGKCHTERLEDGAGTAPHNHPTAGCTACHGNPTDAGAASADFPHTSSKGAFLKGVPDGICVSCHVEGTLP